MQPRSGRPRDRILMLLIVVIALGICSRIPNAGLAWTGKRFGDAAWATMFYLLLILVSPRMTSVSAFVGTLAITFAIEFLKLDHAVWIEALRRNRAAGFLMGHDFHGYDFISYFCGATLATVADCLCLGGRPISGALDLKTQK